MQSPEEQTAQATAAQTRHAEQLMRLANVQGTAVGLAKVKGQYTDQIALVVLVSVKLPLNQLAPEDVIPRDLDGVRVDVQEIGLISAQ
jgi:hypothetical protein